MTESNLPDHRTVRGIGGVFLYSEDPQSLAAWYTRHLGIEMEWGGPENCGASYSIRDEDALDVRTQFVWAILAAKKPLPAERTQCVINYRVADLDGLVARLRSAGVVIERTEEGEYGRFAWISDPEANRVELWEPPRDR